MKKEKRRVTLKVKLILFIALFAERLPAQEVMLGIENVQMQGWRDRLYCAGLQNIDNKLTLKVYRFNNLLAAEDSAAIDLGAGQAGDYLSLESDTLHGSLSYHVQKKSTDKVDLYRFSEHLALAGGESGVEIARLNSLDLFGNEHWYDGNQVYTINVKDRDSTKQFYLEKFSLIDPVKNYEYQRDWQFAFERKNVQGARILGRLGQTIFLLVWRGQAEINTQWLLCIDRGSGNLRKAVKMTTNDVPANFFPHRICILNREGRLLLAGQYLDKKNLREIGNPLKPGELIKTRLRICLLDSLAEIKADRIFDLPDPSPAKGEKKILQLSMNQVSGRQLSLCADIFSGVQNCFRYRSSCLIHLKSENDSVQFSGGDLRSVPEIDFILSTPDKKDQNGLICLQGKGPGELFYGSPVIPVRLAFRVDSLNRGEYLLKRSDLKKASLTVSSVRPAEKKSAVKILETLALDRNPGIYIAGNKSLVTGTSDEPGKYRLKLYIW